MIVKNNFSSIFANRQVGLNEDALRKSMEKLSSGERINRASDDAAGLAVSEKMRAQIRGLNQASRNTADGINFIQTSEGYLNETTEILQRIRELAVQSSNGIYSYEDRLQLQTEVSSLVAEVDRIASAAQFNGMNMFTGRFSKGNSEMTFHVGANMDQQVKVNIGTMTAMALGLKGSQDGTDDIISVGDAESANRVIGTIDEALKNVNKQRADLGAAQNRLEMTQKGLNINSENLIASESRIKDTDFASGMVNYTKNQILTQSAAAMLAQSNTNSSLALQLLK